MKNNLITHTKTSANKNSLWKFSLSSNGFFYISLVLLFIATGLLVAALLVQRNDDRRIQPSKGYNTGISIKSGLVTMSVEKVRFDTGQGRSKSPPGQQHAIVNFIVQNNSSQVINILPSTDTYIKDSTGNVSYLSPYNLDKPFRAGALSPGEQIKGELSYTTASSGDLKFIVDSIWSGGPVSFKIQ